MRLLPKGGWRLILLLCIAGASGCVAVPSSSRAPLRVGVTPDYPPLIFKQGNDYQGLEADFARALGQVLGRPVQFVEMRWDDQIPALMDGRTDIIMSAMSVTQPRRMRVAFSEPYLRNKIRVIFRRKDAGQFKAPDAFLKTDARVGVVAGTTADAFVQKNCPNARRWPMETRHDAAFYLLKNRRIDAYVDDSFALAQILSENEAGVAYLEQPLAEEDLAWAVRPTDQDLLAAVNAALKQWKADGSLNAVVHRWMPYLKKMK